MLFINSIDFIIFFPIVVALFFALPHRFRWMLLLAASYYFCMCWKAEYALLILSSTIVDYYAARRMQQSEKNKRFYLGLSLMSNLGMLFGFKYFNFFNESARAIFHCRSTATSRDTQSSPYLRSSTSPAFSSVLPT